jgi:hypothetical protein
MSTAAGQLSEGLPARAAFGGGIGFNPPAFCDTAVLSPAKAVSP